eukprot:g45814.t1
MYQYDKQYTIYKFTDDATVVERKEANTPATIYINGTEVDMVESIKFRGVTITISLSWTCHIDVMVKKAQQHLFFLRKLGKFVDTMCKVPVGLKRGAGEYLSDSGILLEEVEIVTNDPNDVNADGMVGENKWDPIVDEESGSPETILKGDGCVKGLQVCGKEEAAGVHELEILKPMHSIRGIMD